eukprot:g2822.t1
MNGTLVAISLLTWLSVCSAVMQPSVRSVLDVLHESDSNDGLSKNEVDMVLKNIEYTPTNEILRKFKERFRISVLINVRLIGFGENVSPSRLSEHLETAFEDANLRKVYVQNPSSETFDHFVGSLDDHDLGITLDYHFKVLHDESKLLRDISEVLEAQFRSASVGQRQYVDVKKVDDLVQRHYVKYFEKVSAGHHGGAYSLYIINPELTGNDKYSYVSNSNKKSVCATTHWLGTEGHRYIWFDTKATKTLLQVGKKNRWNMPLHLALQDRIDAPTNVPSDHFTAQLAILTRDIVRHFISPTINGVPRVNSHVQEIRIHLVAFHDITDEMKIEKFENPKWWDKLKEALRNIAKFGHQKLTFISHNIHIEDCPECGAALHSSISEISNSEELVKIDASVLNSIVHTLSEGHWRFGLGDKGSQVLDFPVFLFRVSPQLFPYSATVKHITFNGYQLAAPFKDMVIAVSSTDNAMGDDLVLPHLCDGEHVNIDTANPQRAIVASLLTSIWGVGPSTKLWDPLTHHSHEEYIWGLGNTPFGAMSSVINPSFAQIDAANRNPILSEMNSTRSFLVEILQRFGRYSHQLESSLPASLYDELQKRVAILSYKLQKSADSLAMYDYEYSSHMIDSTWMDLDAIQYIVDYAASSIQAVVACNEPMKSEKVESTVLFYLLLGVTLQVFIGIVIYICVYLFGDGRSINFTSLVSIFVKIVLWNDLSSTSKSNSILKRRPIVQKRKED